MEDEFFNKTKDEENDKLTEEESILVPNEGETYDMFIRQSLVPGSSSFLAHKLISNFDDEKKKEANDIIEKTLAPGDLISHVLKQAKVNSEVADALRREIAIRTGRGPAQD